jgi:exoribonuclease R
MSGKNRRGSGKSPQQNQFRQNRQQHDGQQQTAREGSLGGNAGQGGSPSQTSGSPGKADGRGFDLARAALDEMHEAGFRPEFGAGVAEQLAEIEARFAGDKAVGPEAEDLRGLGWSSIDNDTSRDLDQIEVAERVGGGIRLRVAIGDVAAMVAQGTPIDRHAEAQTQTIYTAVKNFPMLPLELSTGLTSLNENADRLAVMMSFTVDSEGQLSEESVSPARVRNRAQLAYSRVGPWLERTAAGAVDEDVAALRSDSAREHGADPTLGGDEAAAEDGAPGADGGRSHVPEAGHWAHNASRVQEAGQAEPATDPTHDGEAVMNGAPDGSPPPQGGLRSGWLVEQLRLQDEAAQALHGARVKNGALEFHKAEADPVVADGRVLDVREVVQNRAMDLIEDLMVAANGVMARALRRGGRSGLQRVVRIPQRWDRIVALAAQPSAGTQGTALPAAPDSVALNNFLEERRRDDALHYPDLALAVIKLMGPGEYMLIRPQDDPTGHFGLAARDYTHSTAPNRRFPDLVTQRVLHAMLSNDPPPYSDDELAAIALHCNEADKALRKIERDMQKRVAAVAMASRVGEVFAGVITGANDKGVYARVISPPFEGRVVQGEDGLDVGDKVRVKLIRTDPARAHIDFAKVAVQ